MRFNALDKVTGVCTYGKDQKITRSIPKKFSCRETEREIEILSLNDLVPKDATHKFGGYFYKFGAHDFTYIWDMKFKMWIRTEFEITSRMRL